MTCDHVTGEYICRPGYLGLTCEHPCPPNRYGLNCANHCHCKNGGECHHVTGVCQCRPGWQGEFCQIPCMEGTYGMNCSQHCTCQHGGKCRSNDGHCRCAPGWTGTKCTEICPEGYYGDHCMEPCDCKNDFYMCHPADGCICRHGYTGLNCDEELFSRNIQEKDDLGYGSIIAGFFFAAFVVIAMVLAGWIYHRRRVADLKNEIAQVQYIAEPPSPPEQTQFDNPVYAYQGSSKFDDGTTTLLNNFQFRNNLGTSKKINNEKVRLGINSCTDDEDDCKGSYNRYDLKNRDADMGNPNLNVYHSIDEMDGKKVEHVYDEIKQNNDESEYDQLDNPRPISNYKQFNLMPNGFCSNSSDNPGPSNFKDKDPELGKM
uniref:Multiple epidermal growth factor-like domains protein 10 n=2 Tax=Apis cerana TaxID=7461 RepID=V9IF37_APICE